MNRIKSLFLFFIIDCAVCVAQVSTVTAGLNLSGKQTMRYAFSDTKENFSYEYEPTTVFELGYQGQSDGFIHGFEIGYGRYSLSNIELDYGELKQITSETPGFDPRTTDDLTAFSFMALVGRSFNAPKRIQFPLIYGYGLDYLSNDVAHNLAFCLGAKARVKFYLTDNIGVYAGANWRGGLSLRRYDAFSSDSEGQYYTMYVMSLYFDGCLCISF